ncbi:hypothetical protein HHI36_020952 [Cryptolaemus montrouzieri]|uniref:Kinesin-like protein n=1 Tax=Cryptolaemus montrouzieri TaxID=559131 RepID=A0ABD2NDH6_9CUCU
MRPSLLKARDPSIITCNLACSADNNEAKTEKDEKHLHVYLRIKGGVQNYDDLYEIADSRTLISKVPGGFSLARNMNEDIVKKKYNFTKIFGPQSSQIEIFDELVKPKFFNFINGENCTLLTYGASSSGKTYTITGTAQAPGLLPRSLEYLFKTLPKLQEYPEVKPLPNEKVTRLTKTQISHEMKIKGGILKYNWKNNDKSEHINTYRNMQMRLEDVPSAMVDEISNLSTAVWVSFAEIYNENVHDLLQLETPKRKKKLKLGNLDGHTYIKNLTYVYVSSGLEAYQVLQYGLHNQKYAKTKINDHSSRSHSIFTIIFAQVTKTGDEYSVSRFNFCDLAGAERSKKTMNVGDRQKESNSINSSLMVLGRCIEGVRNAQKVSNCKLVPFRDSKLTYLFQRALSGQENIFMVVNVNPCRELFDETQHVLNFSAIAKEVIIQQPDFRKKNRLSQYVLDQSTEILSDDEEDILAKKKRINELIDSIADYSCRLSEEERLQFSMRAELLAKHQNKFEERINELENEFVEKEMALKRKYEMKLKAHLLSIKEKHSDLSITSDSSDDFDLRTVFKKFNKKRSPSPEVITVYSSDEEEDKDFWLNKVQIQEYTIKELEKKKENLGEKVNNLKVEIENKRAKIKELVDLEETLEEDIFDIGKQRLFEFMNLEQRSMKKDSVENERAELDEFLKIEKVLKDPKIAEIERIQLEKLLEPEELLMEKELVEKETAQLNDHLQMEELLMEKKGVETKTAQCSDHLELEELLMEQKVVERETAQLNDHLKPEEILMEQDGVEEETAQCNDHLKLEEMLMEQELVEKETAQLNDHLNMEELLMEKDGVEKETAESLEMVELIEKGEEDVENKIVDVDELLRLEEIIEKETADLNHHLLLETLLMEQDGVENEINEFLKMEELMKEGEDIANDRAELDELLKLAELLTQDGTLEQDNIEMSFFESNSG